MEDSPILENVSISEWAKQIRQMKLDEIELMIAECKKLRDKSPSDDLSHEYYQKQIIFWTSKRDMIKLFK